MKERTVCAEDTMGCHKSSNMQVRLVWNEKSNTYRTQAVEMSYLRGGQ